MGSFRRVLLRFGVPVGGLALAAIALTSCNPPVSFDVTSTADAVDASPGDGVCQTAGGACTLRAAIQESGAEGARGTISLHAPLYVLTIAGAGEDAGATGDLDVLSPIVIDGNGATIDAGHLDRAFDIPASAPDGSGLRLNQVTVTGGVAPAGGGIHVAPNATSLTLHESTVTGNESTGHESCFATDAPIAPVCDDAEPGGGGIYTAIAATVDGSTIDHNTASGPGGCVTTPAMPPLIKFSTTTCSFPGGGGVTGPLDATNSTISDNAAPNGTGGVFAVAHFTVETDPPAGGTLTHVTMSGNTGGGTSTVLGPVTLAGSALAGSAPVCSGSDGTGGLLSPAPSSTGSNAATDGSCGLTRPGDHPNASMPLGSLSANGGPTRTNLPGLGGVLIDAIPAGTPTLCEAGSTDQRGQPRPRSAGCEIGAVEGDDGVVASPGAFTVNDAGDAPDAAVGDGHCATATNTCTLRAAFGEVDRYAALGTTIRIGPGVDPQLTVAGAGEDAGATGDLDVRHDVTLEGDGATITSNGTDRVFDIGTTTDPGPTVVLDHVTITGGHAATGGAILTRRGSLTLDDATVTGNAAATGGGIELDGGTVSLVRSTIDHNTATSTGTPARGGGVYVHGGHLDALDTTVDTNSASGTASATGGNLASDGGGATLRYTTASADAAGGGAGVWATAAAPIQFRDSVLADPRGNCSGSVVSQGYNLVTDGSCAAFTTATDLVSTPAGLGPLADNGGLTRTRVPVATSAAVQHPVPGGTAGECDATVPIVDQRGATRWDGAGCDRGAVEVALGPLTLVVDRADDAPDASVGDGQCTTAGGGCTLRAAIDEANAWLGADTIVIAPGVNPSLTLTGPTEDADVSGDLDVRDDLTMHGNGATVTAAPHSRVLDVAGAVVSVDHLTLTSGAEAAGGDLRIVGGSTTLDHVTVRNGSSPFSEGGGIYVSGTATVQMTDSTVASNTSTFGGGGIRVAGGQLGIEGSTVSGNVAAASNASGGAIAGIPGTADITVTRSTISDNRAGQRGGALYGNGLLLQATIAGNASTADGTTIDGGFVLLASLVSGRGPLCAGSSSSGGYNQIGDTTCTGSGGLGDQIGKPPLLGPLGDHGGATATRLLYSDSSAIDAIPTDSGLCVPGPPTDQRGGVRPVGAGCDIGAVEGSSGTPAPTVALTVTDAGDSRDDDPGDGICHDAGAAAGQCSLRAAIDEANVAGKATVTVAAGVDPTLTRTGDEQANAAGDLDLFAAIALHGNGSTIHGLGTSGADRVIVANHAAFSFDHVTITGGAARSNGAPNSGLGGGVLLDDVSSAALDHVTLTGNQASLGGGLEVISGGAVTITDSTISGNSAQHGGGVSGGAHPLTIRRSTISGNSTLAGGLGGGISQDSGTLVVEQSTLSGNTASVGGGLHAEGTVTLRADTFAANTATTGNAFDASFSTISTSGTVFADAAPACSIGEGTTVVSGGYDVAGDASCQLTQPTDHQGTNALLGALASNGGPTLTRLPAAGSALVNAIPLGTTGLCDASAPTDQRGVVRPQGAGCDIGAVERQPSDP